jgi:hypothetical protein
MNTDLQPLVLVLQKRVGINDAERSTAGRLPLDQIFQY